MSSSSSVELDGVFALTPARRADSAISPEILATLAASLRLERRHGRALKIVKIEKLIKFVK